MTLIYILTTLLRQLMRISKVYVLVYNYENCVSIVKLQSSVPILNCGYYYLLDKSPIEWVKAKLEFSFV